MFSARHNHLRTRGGGHAARCVERARHLAFALKLARIADVDERHVVAAMELARVLDAERLHLALGLIEHLAEAFCDGLRHLSCLLFLVVRF